MSQEHIKAARRVKIMGERLKIGIVGCGVIGRHHAQQLQLLETAVTAGFVDSVQEKAEQYAIEFGGRAYSNYADMLQDPEITAVSICTPSGMHGEMTIAAARAKKHVIVEKPMDINMAMAQRMVEECREEGVMLAGIFQHRFDYASLRVKQMLEEGRFGKLILVNGNVHWYRSDAYYESGDWRGTWTLDGGGVLMNQAIHTVDLVQYFGGPVLEVTAKTANRTHPLIETEDVVVALFSFQNGAMGSFTATSSAYPGLNTRVEIIGETGTCIIENNKIIYEHYKGAENIGTHGMDPSVSNQWEPELEASSQGVYHKVYGDSHFSQLSNFVEAICTGHEPKVSGEDSLHALELVLAVYRSQETRQTVLLPRFA